MSTTPPSGVKKRLKLVLDDVLGTNPFLSLKSLEDIQTLFGISLEVPL